MSLYRIMCFHLLELEGCESGKCSARGVCMCESASEWEVEMGLPWWCLLCKIVLCFWPRGPLTLKLKRLRFNLSQQTGGRG